MSTNAFETLTNIFLNAKEKERKVAIQTYPFQDTYFETKQGYEPSEIISIVQDTGYIVVKLESGNLSVMARHVSKLDFYWASNRELDPAGIVIILTNGSVFDITFSD